MKYAYQILPRQSQMTLEEGQRQLTTFPSVLNITEETYQSLAGPMRNRRAYVEVAQPGVLTVEQQNVLATFGLSMKPENFSPWWEAGELEAKGKEERDIRRSQWEEHIAKNHPQARYYLCYFRQEALQPFDLGGTPPITVRFVHPESFPIGALEKAQERAQTREKEHWQKNDFNLHIEPRLADTADDARIGTFLDG